MEQIEDERNAYGLGITGDKMNIRLDKAEEQMLIAVSKKLKKKPDKVIKDWIKETYMGL